MKQYKVKTIAKYTSTVIVEADSVEEAEKLAHEQADYQFSHWYDAVILSEEDIEDE